MIAHFPEVDKKFLSQTETLILNGQNFDQNRDYPTYLKKLKDAGVKYLIIEGRKVSYVDQPSPDQLSGRVINVFQEFDNLSPEQKELAEPDLDVIHEVTGSALSSQGISLSRRGKGLLKAETLY